MIKLSNVKLHNRAGLAELRSVSARLLRVSEDDILELIISKLSVDARRKSDVHFVYTLLVSLADEMGILAKGIKNVSPAPKQEPFEFPSFDDVVLDNPPVIAGMGPAGLFAALCLAEAGVKCIVLERGQPVDERVKSVSEFWEKGVLNENSNVQFGEGGAGTFSDGKLTTGINDKRIGFVLKTLVTYGASEDIMYLAKPHIGTDRLRGVVAAIRKRLIELGCDVRFGHKLLDVKISDGVLTEILVQDSNGVYPIYTGKLILAPGNSSRDTFSMLFNRGIKLSPKSFSVGVRLEHLQRGMDFVQYGKDAMASGVSFPASDYKLAVHLQGGRSVYTFCVCPGGEVVAAASEFGGVVTNGMSHYARDGKNINGALLVSVTPDDFENSPLGGVAFQRKLEKAAFAAGGGDYSAPAQLVGDFLKKRASVGNGKITPSYLPGVKYCNLWDVLPKFVCEALFEALPLLSKKISGFAEADAVMTAVETRSSCPVRIERENFETVGIRGIFPCGEGAGYAGGIMSAAVDGIRCAEAVLSLPPLLPGKTS